MIARSWVMRSLPDSGYPDSCQVWKGRGVLLGAVSASPPSTQFSGWGWGWGLRRRQKVKDGWSTSFTGRGGPLSHTPSQSRGIQVWTRGEASV